MTRGNPLASINTVDGMDVDTSGDSRLSAYLKALARRRGYNIDAARGGDKGRLAADAGISLTTLSRALNEGRTPDTRALAGLAKALEVDFEEFLVDGGVIPPELATRRSYPTQPLRGRPAFSLDDVADEMHATDAERSILGSMLRTILPSLRTGFAKMPTEPPEA